MGFGDRSHASSFEGSIAIRATIFLVLIALVAGPARPSEATHASSVLEQHWDLLGTSLTSSNSTVNETIRRGSLPYGTTRFDPQPTATFEVVGRVTGATGQGGWRVTLRKPGSSPDVASVKFTNAQSDFSILSASVAWPSSSPDLDLLSIRLSKEVALGELAGTVEVKKAYLKIRQSGAIKKTVTRVPLAGKQIGIVDTSWQDIADVAFYKHVATDFVPTPTIRLRSTGVEGTQNPIFESLRVRLVNSAGSPVTGAENVHAAHSSVTSGPISLADGQTYKVQVRVDAAVPPENGELHSAELEIEQQTSDSGGLGKAVAFFPMVTTPGDFTTLNTRLNQMMNAPDLSAISLERRWAGTIKRTSGVTARLSLFDVPDSVALADIATTSASYSYQDLLVADPIPTGRDLDGASGNSAGSTGRVSIAGLRVAVGLRGVPVITPLMASIAKLSVNADGIRDTTTFTSTITDEASFTWTLVVKDASETTVKSWPTGSTGAVSQVWDGKNDAGEFLPDGTYTATLTATNAAGLSATAAKTVAIDRDQIRYIYDELGRLKAVVDPASDIAVYSYDAVGNNTSISRTDADVARVVEFTPNSAPVGASVQIFGAGFGATPPSNTVQFNGVPATVSEASRTRLVATVPVGATTGVISVSSPGGSASSADSFTVAASATPTISGIAPSIAAPGSTVTITGTNFSTVLTNNRVAIGRTHARVSAATPTTLTVTVPPHTLSGRLSVVTAEGSATGPDLFVPPPGYSVASVQATDRIAYGQTKSLSLTSGTGIGLLIFDAVQDDRVFVDTVASSPGGDCMRVTMFAPDERQLVSACQDNSLTNSYLDTRRLQDSGTHTLLVDSDGAGSISMHLYQVPEDATGSITIGGSSATVTTTAGQNASLSFTRTTASGGTSNRIFLDIISTTYGACVHVDVRVPSGAGLENGCMDSNNYMDSREISQDGTYTISFDPIRETSGSMTVQLYDVPADASQTITPTASGTSATVNTVVGQAANINFTAVAGQQTFLRVSAETYPGCVRIILYNPADGEETQGCKSAGGVFDTRSLGTTGTYRWKVDAYGPDAGSATVVIYNVPADYFGSIVVGGPQVRPPNNAVGQNSHLTFAGTAGQAIRLDMTQVSSSLSCSQVLIFRQSGSQLANDSCVATAGESLSTTLPATETYRVKLDPRDADVGSITFGLVQTGGGAALPPIPVSPAATQIGSAGPRPGGDVRVPASLGSNGVVANAVSSQLSALIRANADSPLLSAAEPTSSREAVTLPLGTGSLTGVVRTLDDKPLANVRLAIDDYEAHTDPLGRFVLVGPPVGPHEFVIDGRTANALGREFGLFETRVEIKDQPVTELAYTIWMPELDNQHTVQLAYPTTKDIVLTTPEMPGLEVHIPEGTYVANHQGKPITEMGITVIPPDRPPFPIPDGFPMYFTLQPGDAYFSQGVRVLYPNILDQAPGEKVRFWENDPSGRGWYVYGQGTVSPDGDQVIPDPGTLLWQTAGSGYSRLGGILAALLGPVLDWMKALDGDPVDLGTGLFVLEKTDLYLPDVIPIAINRTYRQSDSRSRAFGIGASHQYDLFLQDSNANGPGPWYAVAELVMPDSARIRFTRISGTNQFDSVLEAQTTPTAFYKARISWNGAGWNLRMRDGTLMVFDAVAYEGDVPRLTQIRDRQGNALNIWRNATRQIEFIKSPNGRWVQFTYDGSSRVQTITDNIGRVVRYSYTDGRLTKVEDPSGTATAADNDGDTVYTYEASTHRLLTIMDPKDIVYLTNEYDTSGRVKKQTMPEGVVFEFAYVTDGNGKITKTTVTDPRGNLRVVEFNADGFMTKDTAAFGTSLAQTTEYVREAGTNRISAVIDPLTLPGGANRRTEFTYWPSGNIHTVTELANTADAVTTTFEYQSGYFDSPLGYDQLTKVTDPLSHATTFTLGSEGNVSRITDANGNWTDFVYAGIAGEAGLPTSVDGPLTAPSMMAYDLGDLTVATDSAGTTSKRFTDSAGRMLIGTDPQGARTAYTYDVLNQVTEVIDPLNGLTKFVFDPNGNLTRLEDARANATQYVYDNLDRLTTRIDPLNRSDAYTYLPDGALRTFTDRRGKRTWLGYDDLDRRSVVQFDASNDAGSGTYESKLVYTYDNGNRLDNVKEYIGVEPNPQLTQEIILDQDPLDRLVSEQTKKDLATVGTVSYSYDDAGRREAMTVAGQPPVTYTWDNGDRLDYLTQGTSTVDFGYDTENRLTSQTLPNGVVSSYRYDAASRIADIQYTKAAATLGELAYRYDTSGRVTNVLDGFARTGLPAAFSSATHDAANRLTARGSTSYSYDLAGNLESDGVSTYSWNARGELASVGGPNAASFTYDPFGRRLQATDAGVTTKYLHDGANVVQEIGSTSTANLLTGLGTDQTFSRTDGSGTRYLLADALGSTVALADGTGSIGSEYTYDPFGATAASGSPNGNPFRFTGRQADATGLHYLRARYYSPALGRFISQDPIGFAGGDANLYSYVGNSPTNFTDPSGLFFGDFFVGLRAMATSARKFMSAHFWDIVTIAAIVAAGVCLATVACATAIISAVNSISPLAASLMLAAGGTSGLLGSGAQSMSRMERTGQALKSDAHHRAVSFVVDDPAAQRFVITGGDGVQRTLYQVSTEVNGKPGVAEWIIQRVGGQNVITHQRFKPGTQITGRPN